MNKINSGRRLNIIVGQVLKDSLFVLAFLKAAHEDKYKKLFQ